MQNIRALVLAAIPLFLLVWIVLPTQHLFQPLEALGWSNTSRNLCTDHACLGTSDGLQIIGSYMQHMSTMWDFVDGFGHPGSKTFFPASRRLDPATYSGWPNAYNDPVAVSFLDHLVWDFLLRGDYADSMLDNSLGSVVTRFDTLSRKLKKISQVLMDLKPSQAKYKAVPGYDRAYLAIETDNIFNSSVVELASELSGICTDILNRIEESKLMPTVLEVNALGEQMTDGLDGELLRVRNVVAHLPWWDTWTFAHWEGRSHTIRYRAYLKFFQEEEETLRTLAYVASAFHNNLVGLRDYCIWYIKDDTSRLINTDRSREATPDVQDIARDIERLSNRIEDAWNARVNNAPDHYLLGHCDTHNCILSTCIIPDCGRTI
ncbi:hypothetical protein C8R46DRAFT_1105663 [Mycena filopes]|nr:hypothetical protein C8R46DRAFT_1105663 [Mycena filopes]